MAVCIKLYQRILFPQGLRERNLIFNAKKVLYYQLTYTQYSSKYPKAIIEDKIVYSPFNNVPVDTTNNLYTFIWSRGKLMEKTALVCGVTGSTQTFAQLKSISDAFGSALLQQGFKPGQVIAVILPNCLDMPAVLLGIIAAGLSVCSVNPAYTSGEMKHQILNCNAAGIVTYSDLWPTVEEALSEIDKPLKVFVTSSSKQITNLSNKFKIISYEQVVKENINNNVKLLIPKTKSEDLFHISHSSGTTGLPKGIWLSHGNFVNNVIQSVSVPSTALQKLTTEKYQDVALVVLPMYHNYALNILMKCLYLGTKVIILPKFDGNLFINALENYQVTVMYVVPPIIQYLLHSNKVSKDHTKHVKHLLCAGAPLNIPDFEQLAPKTFPETYIRQGYGLSEGTCFVTLDSTESKKPQSVGIPVPNTQLKITDLQDGTDKGVNDEGEICFKGPQMTKGYINNRKANEESIDKDGWFHTGDIGYYDEDGYLFVVDRLKDMIKVKGFQVSPTELEELLKTHELISDAAVLGVPHTRKGEAPIAFITTRISDYNKDEIEQQIRKFVESKVTAYKQIEKYIFVDKIPKTLSGKILRKDLKILLKSFS